MSFVSIDGNGVIFSGGHGISVKSFGKSDGVCLVKAEGGTSTFVIDGKEYSSSRVKIELTLDDGKKTYIPYSDKLYIQVKDSSRVTVETTGDVSVTTGTNSSVKALTTNGSINITSPGSTIDECSATNGNITVKGVSSIGRCSTTNGNIYK